MDSIKWVINSARFGVNGLFVDKEPWQIVTITTSSVLLSIWFYEFIFQDESLATRAKKTFFKYTKMIPCVKEQLDKRMLEVRLSLEKDIIDRNKHLNYITTLPEKGLSQTEIMEVVEGYLDFGDYNWRKGRVSGAVYYSNEELYNIVTEVYRKTCYTNPLHPDVFPGLSKMEAEVVQMGVKLFHGDPDSCGTMTSGGTESILMACKAYRDFAKEEWGIKKPEMVLPVTAHAAFDKAAHYFKIRIRHIAVDPVTTQVDLDAMRSAINNNTIMLVGSAPNFPYGTMDDIAGISDLGLKYGIPVHVDSCLGGFLTAFMSDAGYPVPICDFRLPGVTSISADTHKYAFSPKGSSLVLYREKIYRHFQYYVTADWPGGIYGSPTISGSRAGGAIASCWATLLNFGKEGYVNATREIIHTTKYIEKGLKNIKGIYIFGEPATSVIAIGSRVFDILRLSEMLMALGWSLNTLQFPSGIHICVTYMHTQAGVADELLNDIRTSITEILKNPDVPAKGKLALYGTAQTIPDRTIVGDFTRYFLDAMYYTPDDN